MCAYNLRGGGGAKGQVWSSLVRQPGWTEENRAVGVVGVVGEVESVLEKHPVLTCGFHPYMRAYVHTCMKVDSHMHMYILRRGPGGWSE